MKKPITVMLDGEDAAIVGKTLQALARTQRSPDLEMTARLHRVGTQLYSAALVEGVVELAACPECKGTGYSPRPGPHAGVRCYVCVEAGRPLPSSLERSPS